jgi:DNA-binding MarR family transcriptional regulator
MKKGLIMNDFPFGKHISYLYRIQQSFLAKKTEDYDISGGQLSFIFTLFAHPGCSQEDVARMLELDKTTVARALSKMEKNETIKRIRDSKDQRVMRLYLTDKGLVLNEQLKKLTGEWYKILVEDMSEREIALLKKLMVHMTDNVKNMTHKEKEASL